MNVHRDQEKSFQDLENAHDDTERKTSIISRLGHTVNASGHRDQLKRQYGLLSICGLALTIDNAWVALGGSITVSIGMFFFFFQFFRSSSTCLISFPTANGGPAGVLYELLVACFYYAFVAVSIAEVCIEQDFTKI
jgi:choline transport protein